MFWTKKTTIDTEKIENDLRRLREEVEDLRGMMKKVSIKYEEWLEDARLRNEELRTKVMKKVEYMQKKEDTLDIRQLARRKLMQKAGLIPKDINRWKDNSTPNSPPFDPDTT